MKNATICVYMNEVLKKKLEELANKKNISQNALIRLALIEYIERNS